jgi:hypothetical protein
MKEKLISVLKEVRSLHREANNYLDKVPNDLQMYIMDNTYSNAISIINDRLLHALFGNMYEDVSWFLFEFKPKDTPQIWLADNTPITLTCDEDYYQYLRDHG